MKEIIIKIGAGVLLVIALFASWQRHEAAVYQRGHKAAIAERKTSDDAALKLATDQAHEGERKLQKKFDDQSTLRQKEKYDYENTISGLRDDVRRGRSGMRIPGACLHTDPAPADSSVAGRPVDSAGSVELLPETAESVLDAAIQLRQGVLDRNALIDLYNAARAVCSDPSR